MSRVLVPSQDPQIPSNITVPTNGDIFTAESVAEPIQKLLDALAKIKQEVDIIEAACRAKGVI